MAHADPETLVAMSGGKAEGISPDMVKTASNMISKMSPEELQRMLELTSSFQGENPYLKRDSSGSDFNSFRPGPAPPGMTPDMLKMASDMMSKLPAEELQKMSQMASSLRGNDSVSAAAAAYSNGLRSDRESRPAETRQNFAIRGDNFGESSSSHGFSNSRSAPQSSFPNPADDLQEQMKNQMNDPAMRQMFTSMIKNMSPDMMANMSEQFGFKLSREDAEKAQQTMSSLSPDHLDKMHRLEMSPLVLLEWKSLGESLNWTICNQHMLGHHSLTNGNSLGQLDILVTEMRWAHRIQRGVEGVRKTKNWLLGKPGMVLAVFYAYFSNQPSLARLHWKVELACPTGSAYNLKSRGRSSWWRYVQLVERDIDSDSVADAGEPDAAAAGGEVAGGGEEGGGGGGWRDCAAECAAICCCCPCALVNLVVLAVFKVPTGLCRKAWRKKNRRRMMKKKKALLQQQQQSDSSSKVGLNYKSEIEGSDGDDSAGDGPTPEVDFEADMWDRFYGTGFWRSPSQREE
ncbi:tetratricopeptide repeat (TPR)-like superfamily protein [Actinidia rufa]|uniref:Tetratricopeptide repeat (TPR)-like superfamily protein n=1 Tax=Actinidia rufa TaxID=165716 RepID=A0A7J0GQJ7_9ERIC|nr:tetratricopeptide repeat (TPR)-like superfamily protein [Actinidia rufa]